jgi:hypothetical protein
LTYHARRVGAGDVDSVDSDPALDDAAAMMAEQSSDRSQQRGLAGSVGSEDGDHASGGNSEAQTSEHEDDVVVDNFEAGHL